jgi:hypothetical protein
MIDAGVELSLGEVLAAVRSLVAGFEVDGLTAHEAAQVVEDCAEAERLLGVLRLMAAATLEDKALWRREGFRSVAQWMASKTGTAVGPAIATMEMTSLLADLPVLAEAFRAGRLSEAQAREIAAVASEVPDVEAQLVEAAGKLSLRSLQEECRRVEAAAAIDEDDRYRQVHQRREIRSWVDRHNVGRMSFRGTPAELAQVMAEIDRRTGVIAEGAIKGRWFESWNAHRVDALVEMAMPVGDEPAPPTTMVHVVVDYDALMRGHTVPGERCEIPGIGPIPVTLARQMSEDAILKVLLTKAVDVVAVAHGGYTIPAHLRTALDVRDPKCVVPGCDYNRRLQKDHRNSFGRTQITTLEDLAHLCPYHHYLKTFCGYTYRGGPGTWEWIPPEQYDVDLSALAKVMTVARRC